SIGRVGQLCVRTIVACRCGIELLVPGSAGTWPMGAMSPHIGLLPSFMCRFRCACSSDDAVGFRGETARHLEYPFVSPTGIPRSERRWVRCPANVPTDYSMIVSGKRQRRHSEVFCQCSCGSTVCSRSHSASC